MSKSRILKPKKITILIPDTTISLTFFVKKSLDEKDRICQFDSYQNACSFMTWANSRLGDRFNFLRALEKASIAAAVAENRDDSSFSMVLSEEVLHRLMKKIPSESRRKKPKKCFKNLFGLLPLKKDGYDLSDDDFSTDTSDDEMNERGNVGYIRMFKMTQEEITRMSHIASTMSGTSHSESSATVVMNQLSPTFTQDEINLQKAILASREDEEKPTFPKPRLATAKVTPQSIVNSNALPVTRHMPWERKSHDSNSNARIGEDEKASRQFKKPTSSESLRLG